MSETFQEYAARLLSLSSGTDPFSILESTPAYVECRLVDTVERGDHSIFVGEVVEAGGGQQPSGRTSCLCRSHNPPAATK